MRKVFTLITIALLYSCKNNLKSQAKETDLKEIVGVIETKYGKLIFNFSEHTPQHNKAFRELANEGYYNDFHFNRVIKNFVIQGGCPDSNKYFLNSPYLLKPEFHKNVKHNYGAVGMGRDNNPEKLSNACQLYIVSNKKGLPKLDDNYMIFGQIDTTDKNSIYTLEKIQNLKTDSTDTPLERINMKVYLDTIPNFNSN